MLKVLLLFVLLIAGIVVGPMIAGHQGYVLIQTDNYNIETSVTGLAIILILSRRCFTRKFARRHEPILFGRAISKDKTRFKRNPHKGQLYGRADKLRL